MQLVRRRLALLVIGAMVLTYLAWRYIAPNQQLIRWFTSRDPDQRAVLMTQTGKSPCPGASFILPSTGLIGLLWGDQRLPYTPLHKHSGIDIFGDGEPGTVPVYAAYDGYLTRLPSWRSAVILRHPQDPLDPSRQIWTYYAHMADRKGNSFIADAFPPGSSEVPVAQGTLLGYQGIYNGGSGQIGLHLHFSVVMDDGKGRFLNETDIRNTLDPSPYLGMALDDRNAAAIPQCTWDPT